MNPSRRPSGGIRIAWAGAMRTWSARLLAASVFGLYVLGTAHAGDTSLPALYLRGAAAAVTLVTGEKSKLLLSPEAPADEDQLVASTGIAASDTAIVGTFTSTAPRIDQINVAPTSAVLYLATRTS